MSDELEPIELHCAWSWDCNECGAENFCRGISVEKDPEAMAELRDERGIEPWEAGQWMMMPTAVVCRSCGCMYSTKRESEWDGFND